MATGRHKWLIAVWLFEVTGSSDDYFNGRISWLPIEAKQCEGGILSLYTFHSKLSISKSMDKSVHFLIFLRRKNALHHIIIEACFILFSGVINLVIFNAIPTGGIRWLSSVSIIILLVWIIQVRYAGQQFEIKAQNRI